MRIKFIQWATFALVLFMSYGANAIPTTWTMSASTDGIFDGSTFIYDAANDLYSETDIFGSWGEDYLGGTILPESSNIQLSLLGTIFPDSLLIEFSSALTDAGGSISATFTELINFGDSYETETGTLTVSAEAVNVPEPSIPLLLASGLVVLGLARRKGRS